MFIEAKDDEDAGENWTTGAISHAKLQSNHHTLRFNGLFSGEPGLAGCPCNSPSPFIPELHILL